MLVFSSFCPHAPMLIPSVGKENLDKLKNTISAYEKLEQNFYLAKPDTVIVISPHGMIYDDAISINFCEKFSGDFEEFGDYETKIEFSCDYLLTERLQHHMREQGVATTMDTCAKLDHGASVPMYLLTAHHKDVKLIPINHSEQDLKSHFVFGRALKEVIQQTNQRVAVVASGDLSHRLSTESPAGFSKHGEVLDKSVQDAIANKNSTALLNLDAEMVKEAGECGLKSLVILMGVLHGTEYEPEILSYEAPFGVGYLCCNFKLD
ncbi:AmmeMemoRadiSam system protein B [Patescibacteria group bacterium]|nr:AmmeMemoRadiSam system protein B [Patescibacteria group bacterium]